MDRLFNKASVPCGPITTSTRFSPIRRSSIRHRPELKKKDVVPNVVGQPLCRAPEDRGAPPELGQHTTQVLGGSASAPGEIAALRKANAL